MTTKVLVRTITPVNNWITVRLPKIKKTEDVETNDAPSFFDMSTFKDTSSKKKRVTEEDKYKIYEVVSAAGCSNLTIKEGELILVDEVGVSLVPDADVYIVPASYVIGVVVEQ